MIEKLISDLPEVYQPIYGHPELSGQASRPCLDRLEQIVRIHDALQRQLGRPLEVLDLGCAQGYFSLNLAERGANVRGIDYLDKNIAVCNELAQAHPQLPVSFETGRVEDVIERLEPGRYDLVLGLSVFHHIVHERGADAVKAMLERIANQCGALIAELALHEEPLYWASSQPRDPRSLLESIAFVHEVARHATHLAPIPRPLFVASNRYWILEDRAEQFDSWSSDPHALAHGAHQGSRRYFFSASCILKFYRFDHQLGVRNKAEFKREIQFLQSPPTDFPVSALIAFGESETNAWLATQRLPGRLLLDLLRENVTIDSCAVLLAVLAQLAALEKVGLYHDDVRTWNVLVAEDGATHLIDYGSISARAQDCVWPGNPFLSFFIFVREVTTGVVDDPDPLRTISISPYGLPQPYRAWATSLWRRPLTEWSFQLMHNSLLETPADEPDEPLQQPVEAWMKATEEAIQAQKLFANHLRHQANADKHQYHQMLMTMVDSHSRELGLLGESFKQLGQTLQGKMSLAETLEKHLAWAQEQLIHAERRRTVLEGQVAEHQQRAAVSEALAQQANERAAASEAQAQQANERAAVSEAQAQQANERAAVSEAQAQQIDAAARHWQNQANVWHERILAIHASTSWRITKPMRWAKRCLQPKAVEADSQADRPPSLVLRVKLAVRPALAKGIRYVFAHPNIRTPLSRVLKTIPPLHRRLFRVAVNTGVVECPPELQKNLEPNGHDFDETPQKMKVLPVSLTPDPSPASGRGVRGESSSPIFLSADGRRAHAELVDEDLLPSHAEVFTLPQPLGRRILYVYVGHTVNFPSNTGVQRVTRGLAKGLQAQGECVRYVKWHPETQRCLLISAEERELLARWSGPELTAEERELYPSQGQPQTPVTGVLAGENHWLIVPEVTHITFHQEPVTLDLLMWAKRAKLKTGWVFYDAIPMRRPELYSVVPKHSQYMQHLLLADVIWPISNWAGADLKAFWQEHELADESTMPEVKTLELSGAPSLCERVTVAQTGEPLILSVGSIEPRKNQTLLIQAFQSYCAKHTDTPWELILVGNLHPSVADEVNLAARSSGAIKHLGHVSDEALDQLYRRCAFTVFPSVEEGFGLPILESLWYGKPSICANFGSMAEVAHDGGCLTLDTRNLAALKDGITRLIENPDMLETLSKEAISRPIRTWVDYAVGISERIEREGRPASRLGLVYFWVDSTLYFPKNTGIQRVVRQLARSLMEMGVHLVPVKWNDAGQCFGPVSEQELGFLAQWNGPKVAEWHPWVAPEEAGIGAWFLMPELPLNRTTGERCQLLKFLRKHRIHSVAIFYDAIPWKMRHIYPAAFAQAHRSYMTELYEYDLVLPISVFSKEDLVDFLGGEILRPQSLSHKIKAVSLAGEFAESSRSEAGPVAHAGPLRILCVGTVEPRKNHETLLRAFSIATERSKIPFQLTLAGGSHSIEPALAERVRAFIAKRPNVCWEEDTDDKRLRQLYLESDFTIYPSVEEGFGLPILESLWYARPCICANFGAMLEAAEGGGCLMVDVRDAEALAGAIVQMATHPELRQKLSQVALTRDFKTWVDYATEVANRLAELTSVIDKKTIALAPEEIAERVSAMHLPLRPKLTVCISTYNRAEWLSTCLRNWARMYPQPLDGVELLVCDNASTDHTTEVVTPYLNRHDFSYHRNLQNVGMLGNLRETAHHARGKYVWILGDDDLLLPGAVERVVQAIDLHPELALIYLNYAFTREEDARNVSDFDTFFAQATPIVPPEPDRYGPIRAICARNENFFTAIYTLVLRRDHAMRAYSQDTSGRPFSSMPTCIPTTTYVLGYMMEMPGLWVGTPQIVVNMNVSWMRYAPLWILERVPEVYEVAERCGALPEDMDRWRNHTLPGIIHFFQEIYQDDPMGNSEYFSPERLVRRFKHLPEFAKALPVLKNAYTKAYAQGHPAARRAPTKVFPEAEVA